MSFLVDRLRGDLRSPASGFVRDKVRECLKDNFPERLYSTEVVDRLMPYVTSDNEVKRLMDAYDQTERATDEEMDDLESAVYNAVPDAIKAHNRDRAEDTRFH